MLSTSRLKLRRPVASDAQAMFDAYAGDKTVTRYLAWGTHPSVDATRAFIEFSDQEWATSGAGPLVIESKASGEIVGSTGISLETKLRASTGYVLAQHAWGMGYAAEALAAMVDLARTMSVWRIEAICHHAHERSVRVLEKQSFNLEGMLKRHTLFPNLDRKTPQDVLLYAKVLREPREDK